MEVPAEEGATAGMALAGGWVLVELLLVEFIGGGCCAGCSADSVSCTVQARCSPVSTSKKPVRS